LPAALSAIPHARAQPGRKPTQHPTNQQGNQQRRPLGQIDPGKPKVIRNGISIKGAKHNAGDKKKH